MRDTPAFYPALGGSAGFCDEAAAMTGFPDFRITRTWTAFALAVPGMFVLGISALATTANARDSQGMFGSWGAFSDTAVPRCYAVAMADASTKERDYQPYATVGTWPRRNLRNQVHFRMSRKLSATTRIRLQIGSDRYDLIGGGGDAWAQDAKMNAAIVARMRTNPAMTAYATDNRGRNFSNTWQLEGAASAMDAALLACARVR